MPRSLLVSIVCALATAPLGSSASDEGSLHGAALTLSQPTPLADVLADPERFSTDPVLLHGELVEVCQKKGCWTVLRDGDAHVRVRFEGYGFFVPKDSPGAEAWVQGVATVRVLSLREARHYESERAGGDPSKIEGPQREVGFEASGVRIVARD